VRVYEGIDTFDPTKARFSTWLFNQARYATAKRIRELERQRRGDSADAELPVQFPDPLALVIEEFEASALRRAFLRLTVHEQKLLFLKHVLGCRHVEIGRHRPLDDLLAVAIVGVVGC
jgi:RNA polymerase sigma factor (sigma-70 family)